MDAKREIERDGSRRAGRNRYSLLKCQVDVAGAQVAIVRERSIRLESNPARRRGAARRVIRVVAHLMAIHGIECAEDHEELARRGHVGDQRISAGVVPCVDPAVRIRAGDVGKVQLIEQIEIDGHGSAIGDRVLNDEKRLVGDGYVAPAYLEIERTTRVLEVTRRQRPRVARVAFEPRLRCELVGVGIEGTTRFVAEETRMVDYLVGAASLGRPVQQMNLTESRPRVLIVGLGARARHPDRNQVAPVG